MSAPDLMIAGQILIDLFVCAVVPAIIYVVANITRLNTDVEWIKSAIQITAKQSGHTLHSPHTPEFDQLIEHYWHDELSREDAIRLAVKLDKIISEDALNPIEHGHPYTQTQKIAASQMLSGIIVKFRIKTEELGEGFSQMKRSILYVEDDARDRETVRSFFDSKPLAGKFFMDFATTAREAKERLVRRDYDIIFLDIKMPIESGIAVLEYCQKNCPQIPIIIITAFDGGLENAPIMSYVQKVRKQNLKKEVIVEILQKQKLLA